MINWNEKGMKGRERGTKAYKKEEVNKKQITENRIQKGDPILSITP
jgi:hypothetical protein